MFVELHRSRQLLFRKHYSPGYRIAHRIIVGAGLAVETIRSWAQLQRREIPPAEFRARLAAYRAVLLGTP
jgi:hypothetical protein